LKENNQLYATDMKTKLPVRMSTSKRLLKYKLINNSGMAVSVYLKQYFYSSAPSFDTTSNRVSDFSAFSS
jgi:hypothetical protein